MSEFKPKFILNTGRRYIGEKLRLRYSQKKQADVDSSV